MLLRNPYGAIVGELKRGTELVYLAAQHTLRALLVTESGEKLESQRKPVTAKVMASSQIGQRVLAD